jgi:hypothetical protein
VAMMRVEQSQAEQVSWRAPRLRFRVFSRFFVDFFRRFPFAVQTTAFNNSETMILFVLIVNAIVQLLQDVSNLSSEELRNRISRSTSIRSTLTPAQQLIAARAAAAAAGGKHKQQMTAQSQRTPAPASAVPAKITVVQRHSSDRSSLVADQNKLASCEGCKDVVPAASLISYGDTGVLLCNSCVTRQDAHTSSMLMSLEQARAVNTRLMCEDCGTRPALTRREVCQQCLDVRRAEEAGDLTGSSAAPSLNASLTNSNPDRPFANGLRSTAGQPGALLAVPGKAPAKPDLVVDSDDDLPPPPPPDDASPRSSAFVPSSGEYITLDLAGRNTGAAAAAAAAAGHNAQYGTHMQYGTLPSGGSSIKSQLATSVANDGDVDDEATSIDELDELDVPPPLDSGVFSQPLLNGVDQPAPKLSAIDPSVTLPKLVFNPNKPSGGSRRALPSVPGSRETIEVPKMPLPTTPGEAAAKVAPAAAPAVVVTPAAPSVEPPAPTTQSPGIGDEHALQPNKQMSIRRRIASTAAKNWMVEYDEIEFHQKIGAGSFGEVWTAELWGMECAVKKLPENLISEEAVGDFLSELEILAGLRHPNIVLMIGAVISDDGGRMAIISELCSRGSVNSVLQNAALQSELTLGRRAHFALDCAFAMLYLHKLNICHADLKARNLLIDKDWNAKLCDFGLSMVRTDKTVRLAGTRGYMAPELMEFFGDIYDGRAEMIFTFKSDVYSYGILMSELYCSNDAELVDWANTNEELEAISRGDRPAIPPRMHAAWRSLQERAWSQSPDERPQFKEILAELKPLAREWDAQGAIYPILD